MRTKLPARPGPVDEVIWLDSIGVGRWAPKADHLPAPGEMLHRSIGYVLFEDRDTLTLVQSVGGTDNLDHSITIPKVALIRRRLKSK